MKTFVISIKTDGCHTFEVEAKTKREAEKLGCKIVRSMPLIVSVMEKNHN
jgi:hypothetical protein